MITTKKKYNFKDVLMMLRLQPLSVLFFVGPLPLLCLILLLKRDQPIIVFVCANLETHFSIEFSLILLYQYNNLLIVDIRRISQSDHNNYTNVQEKRCLLL